jgi:hypothetical protein
MANAEAEEVVEIFDDDLTFASATYASHTAELAQAFGNLLSQAARLPADSALLPVAIDMLSRVAAVVETKPKGQLKAISKSE